MSRPTLYEVEDVFDLIPPKSRVTQRQLDGCLALLREAFPHLYIEYVGAFGLCVGVPDDIDEPFTEPRSRVLFQHASIVVTIDSDLKSIDNLKTMDMDLHEEVIGLHLFTKDSKIQVKGATLWEHLLDEDS